MYDNIDKMKYSPMIRQYLEIKEQYPDTLVFYRVGDFYELFFNDAIVGAKELEIVLTGKDAGVEERIPMAGVPYHAVDSYLDTLTEKGYKVAIVEQIEDPKLAQGIVKRDVVRIVTPGTLIDEVALDAKTNNFLVSLSLAKNQYILSYVDLSTGEGYLTNIPNNESLLFAEIIKLNAKEIIVSPTFPKEILNPLKQTYTFALSEEENDQVPSYFKGLLVSLDKDEEKNYCRLLNYIIKTQKRTLVHMQKVVKYNINSYLKIDIASRKNLELLETLRFQNRKNSLLNVLDKCSTAMGSRYLKKALLFPFIEKDKLERRYNIIGKIKKAFINANDLRKLLLNVYDLERLVGRVSYENANPRDFLQLRKSLEYLPKIKDLVKKMDLQDDFDLNTSYEDYMNVFKLIDDAINLDAPYVLKDGNVIKKGYSKELDELKDINLNSKNYILQLEAKEKEKTGIKTLKVGFNKVFGYYIEVSKLQSELVKDEYGYIRKQTLSNAERYITQELKEKEALILRAEEKSLEIEATLFKELRDKVKSYCSVLQNLAKIIAELDMMLAFSKVANENKYVRPSINDNGEIKIIEGRHPVIETALATHYIPNDLVMNKDDSILLITGPNMSGKSTYMRQIALIAIMAQIGCYVPAKEANLPIFDQIFTRIGASDDIVSGQSTFMVEMMEVNNALTFATKNSLILFDEIGRGTATYDGMALAQAIIEYVHNKIGCKTMFSTHYHELTTLDSNLKNLKNVHVSAEEVKGDIVFLHKVKDGPISKSYGINVAKLAKIPTEVIVRANDILNKLQVNENYDAKLLSLDNYVAPLIYDSKSEVETDVINEIKNLNIYEINPMDAMNILNELNKKLK